MDNCWRWLRNDGAEAGLARGTADLTNGSCRRISTSLDSCVSECTEGGDELLRNLLLLLLELEVPRVASVFKFRTSFGEGLNGNFVSAKIGGQGEAREFEITGCRILLEDILERLRNCGSVGEFCTALHWCRRDGRKFDGHGRLAKHHPLGREVRNIWEREGIWWLASINDRDSDSVALCCLRSVLIRVVVSSGVGTEVGFIGGQGGQDLPSLDVVAVAIRGCLSLDRIIGRRMIVREC